MSNLKGSSSQRGEPAAGNGTEQIIDLRTLRRYVRHGVVSDVEVVGRRRGWAIRVYTGARIPPFLATADGEVRLFTKCDVAIHLVIRLGITRLEVIADEYENGALCVPRPDPAAVITQQVEYDAWLKAKLDAVQERMNAGTEPALSAEESRRRVYQVLASGRCSPYISVSGAYPTTRASLMEASLAPRDDDLP